MRRLRSISFIVILSAGLFAASAAPSVRAPFDFAHGVVSVVEATQDSSLRAERTVSFATGKAIALNAKVGPVSVQSVEFSDRGRVTSGLPGLRTTPTETSTMLRAHFLVENPSTDEWEVAFTIELRDRNGKVIDRAVKKSTWEGQAKPFDFDHPILAYVVPLIAEVKITLEGRLD